MNRDRLVRDYLTPAPDSFWEWHEEGEVIVWKDGKTIAFREELRAVLSWLAPHGLPSLDSIALVLAATHDAWGVDGSEAGILAETFNQTVGAELPVIRDVLHGLDQIHGLERELREPLRSKSVLAEVVLNDCPTVAEADTAMLVVDALRRGLAELLARPDAGFESKRNGPLLLSRDLQDILVGLQRLDADALRLRLATGLDALPLAADIQLPPWEAARALIETLQNDRELAGLARVAKQLMAVASLPRRLDTEEHYHTGGFSDIANRGSMERLLISELANDDLTLSVRVAMNEALYLRREIPPATPHRHRVILMDAGIRSWGVPRVFATAVALAFMAGSATKGAFSCFRAKRDSVERVDLATRAGLVEHLRALEADLNPADAIPAFLQQIKDDAAKAEPILLMSDEALRDAAVQQSLRRIELPQVFLATVNRDGLFRLSERGRHGTKLLREAKLDIEELFCGSTPLIETGPTKRLPAIFSVEPFPLLLSHVKYDGALFVAGWGVLVVTRDGRLMHWGKRGRGARQLSDNLSNGKILWIAPAAVDGHLSLIVGGMAQASLMRVDSEGIVVNEVRLKLRSAGESFCARNGVLFAVSVGAVDVLDMLTGDVTETLRLPANLRWKRDRFFYGPTAADWYALTHYGQAARLEPVTCAGDRHQLPPLITMFDQVGTDGPTGVTLQGDLFSTATGILRRVDHKLPGDLVVPWVSADGKRLRLDSIAGVRRVTLATDDLSCNRVNYPTVVDERAWQFVRPLSLRHRFRAIGLNGTGNLTLESRKGNFLSFEVMQGLPVVCSRKRDSELGVRRSLESLNRDDPRCKLWHASWEDGSRAVLDSRGLLHLISSDPSIPEATLVLVEGELSGWSSDGRIWGRQYFVGDNKLRLESAASQHAAYESTIGRFVERLNA